jgi:histidyl-tRNA synthetase
VEKLTQVLTVKTVDGIAELLGKDSPAVQQINKVMSLCKAYGIEDWILFDASVVRGLAYYTGIVFEAFDRKGVLRAIAGGGRYDKLLETFGGDPTPAIGFGFGDAVIVELLKDRDLLPSFESSGIDTVVFAMGEEMYPTAINVAKGLREAGQSVDLVLENKKTKWVFKHADRLGARYCAIIGSEEFANNQVAIKDLAGGEQESVSVDDLASWVAKQNNSSS